MLMSVLDRLNLRSAIIYAISMVMVLSLYYSLSIQSGHADVPVAATAEETQPLRAGQRAPRFVVATVDNEPFVFDPSDLQRPAIVVSFRGGWCPYCNMHLSELRHVIPEISELGVDVLFISGDRPELLFSSLSADTQENIADLDYQIMSDANAHAAIAFGIAFKASRELINRRKSKGDDIVESSMLRHEILPVPAVFAIDKDGLITFSFVEPNYKIRLPADELLTAAKELVQ